MAKLNFFLALAVIASGLFLVQVQHDNRLLYSDISRASDAYIRLKSERNKLLLEHQNLVTPIRIADDAEKLLHMYAPNLSVTEYLPREANQLGQFQALLPSGVKLNEPSGGVAHE